MLDEALAWGLEPAFVTGDSWYSSVDNLKRVRNHRLDWMFALESNRIVSVEKGQWVQVQKLDIPDDGLVVWLKEFGYVRLFRTCLKDQPRHYAVYLTDEGHKAVDRKAFNEQHDKHWHIWTVPPGHQAGLQHRAVFRCAAKPPSETICLPRFVAMSSSRNSVPCQ
jgi:hypothetical protein